MNPKGQTIPTVWSSMDLAGVWTEADLPAPPALSPNQPGIFQPQVAASGPAGVVVVATCSGEAPGPPCPASTYLWQSADGIAWTPYNDGRPVTKRAADTYNQVVRVVQDP